MKVNVDIVHFKNKPFRKDGLLQGKSEKHFDVNLHEDVMSCSVPTKCQRVFSATFSITHL